MVQNVILLHEVSKIAEKGQVVPPQTQCLLKDGVHRHVATGPVKAIWVEESKPAGHRVIGRQTGGLACPFPGGRSSCRSSPYPTIAWARRYSRTTTKDCGDMFVSYSERAGNSPREKRTVPLVFTGALAGWAQGLTAMTSPPLR